METVARHQRKALSSPSPPSAISRQAARPSFPPIRFAPENPSSEASVIGSPCFPSGRGDHSRGPSPRPFPRRRVPCRPRFPPCDSHRPGDSNPSGHPPAVETHPIQCPPPALIQSQKVAALGRPSSLVSSRRPAQQAGSRRHSRSEPKSEPSRPADTSPCRIGPPTSRALPSRREASRVVASPRRARRRCGFVPESLRSRLRIACRSGPALSGRLPAERRNPAS